MDATTMQGTVETVDDVNTLLSMELSDLAALPDIKVPPTGRYTFGITVETKDDGKHPTVQVKYEVVDIVEQVNADETPAKVGDAFFVNYTIDNKWGLGKLNKDLEVYSKYFNLTNIGEIIGAMEGIQIKGTVKHRADTKNLDDEGNPRVYGSVVNVEIL